MFTGKEHCMSSKRALPIAALLPVLVLAISGRATAQAPPSQPQQGQHEHSLSAMHDEKQHEEVNKHGDTAMGFSHMKTTHHFGLTPSGGFIQVQANDPKDTTSRDQIRAHLQHISKAFKEGDFSLPEMTHSRVPPGVPAMQRLKGEIEYKYAETENSGKLVLSTANPEALKAIHEFLRFQIDDHQTGDSLNVQK
jgi:hypothetical protein